MKRLLIIGFLFFVNTVFAQNKDKYLLSINDFEAKLRENTGIAQLVDVRTPEEYIRGHLKRAINLNFNDDNFEDIVKAKLDKTRPVFVYCFSGRRSTDAAAFLRDLGYKEVYDMAVALPNGHLRANHTYQIIQLPNRLRLLRSKTLTVW